MLFLQSKQGCDDKHSLYTKLQASSRKYPNILIVPGSIAYSKARGLSTRKYYNVCPILFGGNIILKKYKVGNDNYQSKGDFKTKGKGNTFTHKNLKFGIDICLDHGHKVLKTSLKGETVDVHVLIADGAAPSPRSLATTTDGVVVYCNMKSKNKDKGVNGILSVKKNDYGNLNTHNRQLVSETSQSLTGGYRIALYKGQVQ
ncbi:hypothetical protein [Endozoicomonas numazuensis]|uniref:hypothetical protein n=1 Tax=Endozoicomonas numazuensis TaxID=1137799 RepID=UPI0012684743|nr:hypothetical protein [Endozoicomonas numazuensis]